MPTAGDIITYSDLDAQIQNLQDQIDLVANFGPAAQVAASGTTTIPNVTGTEIQFDTVHWDRGGQMFTNPSTSLVAPIDGIYCGVGYLVFDTVGGGVDGWRKCLIRINHSTDIFAGIAEGVGAGTSPLSVPFEIFLSAGDEISLVAYSDTPPTVNVIGAMLTARYVGTVV